MTYIEEQVREAEKYPGRTLMFIQYHMEDHAYDRAEWCRQSWPDYEFTVGLYNGMWSVAVTVPKS